MNIYHYIVSSTFCISIGYLGYLILQNNERNFNTRRFYLILTVILAILLPFAPLSIKPQHKSSNVDLVLDYIKVNEPTKNNPMLQENAFNHNQIREAKPSKTTSTRYETGSSVPLISSSVDKTGLERSSSGKLPISWFEIVKWTYLSIASFLLLRLVLQLIYLLIIGLLSKQSNLNGQKVIWNNRHLEPFTYFKWIFLPESLKNTLHLDQVLLHEKVHALQLHSLDLLLSEFYTCIFWFNPISYFLLQAQKSNHEYLADHAVLNAGVTKTVYQTTLINQVAESNLLPVSSGFSKSLLRKRIIMMNSSRKSRLKGLRAWVITPTLTLALGAIALLNGLFVNNLEAEPITKDSSSIETTPNTSNLPIINNGEKPLSRRLSNLDTFEKGRLNNLEPTDNPILVSTKSFVLKPTTNRRENKLITTPIKKMVIKPIKPKSLKIKKLSLTQKEELSSFYQNNKYSYKEVLDLNGENELKVRTAGGGIQVHGNNSNKATIQVTIRRQNKTLYPGNKDFEEIINSITIDKNSTSGIIEVFNDLDHQEFRNVSVSFDIEVPSRMHSTLKTSGGGIRISNLQGDQNLYTSGGGIDASQISGGLMASTSGGGISVSNNQGGMDLKTSGGSINVSNSVGDIYGRTSGGSIKTSNIEGKVDVKTSGGSIMVDGQCSQVIAKTSGGGIKVDVTNLTQSLQLQTSGGSIRATVPKSLGLSLDLKGNRVTTSLHNFSGKSSPNSIVGNINGGGIPITMKTSGGSVNLVYN